MTSKTTQVSILLLSFITSFQTLAFSYDAQILKARKLSWSQETEKAKIILKKLNEKVPNNPEIYAEFGKLEAWENKFDSAIKYYKKSISIKPTYIDAHIGIARVYMWKEDLVNATKSISTAIKIDKRNSEAKELKQKIITAKNLKASIKRDSNFRLTITKARKLSWTGKQEESEKHLARLNKSHPNNIEVLNEMAKLKSWKKEFTLARKIYLKVLEIDPTNTSALVGISNIYSWNEEYSKFHKFVDSKLKRYPKNYELLNLKAKVYSWEGKSKKSILIYNKVLKDRPLNREALIGKGNYYRIKGQRKKAYKYLKKLYKNNPRDIEVLILLGSILEELKLSKYAINYYKRALIIDPKRADIRAKLGLLYGRNLQISSGIKELKKSLALKNDDINNYISLGRLYSWNNQVSNSILLYKKALLISPNNINALYGLGNSYYYIGEWELAENFYKKALKIAPKHIEASEAIEKIARLKRPVFTSHFRYISTKNNINKIHNDTSTTKNFSVSYDQSLTGKFNIGASYNQYLLKLKDVDQEKADYNIDQKSLSLKTQNNFLNYFNFRFVYSYTKSQNRESPDKNFYPLLGDQSLHSGYTLISKDFAKHNFSIGLTREHILFLSQDNYQYAKSDNLFLSDDINVNTFLDISLRVDRTSADNITKKYNTYTVNPQFTTPKFTNLSFEYEYIYTGLTNSSENIFKTQYSDRLKSYFEYETGLSFSKDSFTDIYTTAINLLISSTFKNHLSIIGEADYSKQSGQDSDETTSMKLYLTKSF